MQRLCRLYLHGLPCRIPYAHHSPSALSAAKPPSEPVKEAYHAPLHRPGGISDAVRPMVNSANAYVVTYQPWQADVTNANSSNPSPISKGNRPAACVLPIAIRRGYLRTAAARTEPRRCLLTPKIHFTKQEEHHHSLTVHLIRIAIHHLELHLYVAV